MAAGLGLLRLPPAAFWAMTPKELAAALGALHGPARIDPPSRTELRRLMQAYPDEHQPGRIESEIHNG
ncbi:MAG TPA: phage tail assembly chaperone [Hyphomicrobiaceae bacterium]|jgi:uncharacterized phage protein (TIGR02216 family)